MSTSSTFVILRKDDENSIKISDSELKDAYIFSNYDFENQYSLFGAKYEENDLPEYIQSKKLKYVNRISKDEYDIIMEFDFCSSFSVLIEEFNISSYSVNTTKVISIELAEKMLEAVNYLLNEKYDRVFEENVLENEYVKIFGENYAPYYNYYVSLTKNSNDEDYYIKYDEEYAGAKITLKRVKLILDAFVELYLIGKIDSLKYVLLYCAK